MAATEEIVRASVAELGSISVDADANADLYLDLGLASFHALQLLTDLEEKFQVTIPDDQFVEATSIAKLTSMIEELLAGAA